MTWIAVDPNELVNVSVALVSVATDAAEVGADLSTCVRCPMPAEIEGLVRQILIVTDALVDEFARRIGLEAAELLRRAGVIGSDSVPVAAEAAGLAPSTAFVGGGGSGFTVVSGSGLFTGMGVVGGTPPLTMTISDGLLGGMSVVGGVSSGMSFSSSLDAIGPSMGIIGGGTRTGAGNPMADAVMTLAETGQRFRDRAQSRIDAIIRNPDSSPALVGFALDQQVRLGEGLRTLTAPSRADIAREWGYMPSLAEFHALNTGGFDGIVGGAG